jgi:hypothetical protein
MCALTVAVHPEMGIGTKRNVSYISLEMEGMA